MQPTASLAAANAISYAGTLQVGTLQSQLRPLPVQQADCNTLSAGSLPPSAVKAHEDLVLALEHMHTCEELHHKTKELLKEMQQSRSEIVSLSKKYDTWWVPDVEDQRLVPLSM